MAASHQCVARRFARGRRATASSSTIFHVSSLSKSLDFYSRVLGFAIEFRYGTPETYAGLSWRGVHLHLSSAYPYKNNTGHGNIYIIATKSTDCMKSSTRRASSSIHASRTASTGCATSQSRIPMETR